MEQEKEQNQKQGLELDEQQEQERERIWKEASATLEHLRVMLHKEMSDWAHIQQRIDDLYLRATKDPKAAQSVASLEAYMEECRADVDDAQRRMEQLQALIKEMNLRSAQDRREIQRYKQKVFGSRCDTDKTDPAMPRAGDAAATPTRKRVRRFA